MDSDGEHQRLAEWIARLEQLARRCEDRAADDPGEILRQAEEIIAACPEGPEPWCKPAASRETLAKQRDAGAHVSAALGLLSPQVSLLVSRAAPPRYALATLALPGLDQEASCVAGDLALAITGALATLLAQSFAQSFAPNFAKDLAGGSTGPGTEPAPVRAREHGRQFSRYRPGSLS